ncbi:MAG: CDP-alcohol phosphatidyltransferase family protein [Candidatus Aegiribacteria sp.]|nr:CDP-alcohol phosphatidyltransferase family protein [Candidatus Aegiribacteria sp.]
MNTDPATGKNRIFLRQLNREVQEKAQQIADSFAILPAAITWLRFLGAGMVIMMVYGSLSLDFLFWVILVCGISDYLDGWLARRLKKTSYPGKVMDFTADKLFISVSLIALSFSLGAIDTVVASILVGYHLLLLFSLSAISWSIHVPVVTITTGERLAVLFSYLLLMTAAGRLAFPHKQIFQSLHTPLTIIALLSAFTGLLSYLRLLRRLLSRFLE